MTDDAQSQEKNMNGPYGLLRPLLAEALGTALLLATVVGSGIMAESLAQENDAIALLGNTLATGAILVVLILVFGPISGAHFNPAVTLAFLLRREIKPIRAVLYVGVQCLAAIGGVMLAHLMFDVTALMQGVKIRTGGGQWLGEAVAAFGLVLTILSVLKSRPDAVPYAVGLFITAGYWFTSSTSFANPAVTLARSFTDSFAGIRLVDVPGFVGAQCIGAVLAVLIAHYLWAGKRVAKPHPKPGKLAGVARAS